ncbi:hypothetical protein [Streptomyces lavenduligriseus]|uniref:DNA-binding protein n=1 Tax=Streptomyces lavenduligriseus TaxID=67315 RepID=A0ABT0P5V0_9ACTN|nr:hypothetical protein [Streptomyces lavenduligriseus]MCL3999122.1 hypothetical protein [Streptomyces lavenduligriseus]
MASGPPVRKTITFHADAWENLQTLANQMGTTPEDLVVLFASRLTRSPEGNLELKTTDL